MCETHQAIAYFASPPCSVTRWWLLSAAYRIVSTISDMRQTGGLSSPVASSTRSCGLAASRKGSPTEGPSSVAAMTRPLHDDKSVARNRDDSASILLRRCRDIVGFNCLQAYTGVSRLDARKAFVSWFWSMIVSPNLSVPSSEAE